MLLATESNNTYFSCLANKNALFFMGILLWQLSCVVIFSSTQCDTKKIKPCNLE